MKKRHVYKYALISEIAWSIKVKFHHSVDALWECNVSDEIYFV